MAVIGDRRERSGDERSAARQRVERCGEAHESLLSLASLVA
jgi:hypothetical protein